MDFETWFISESWNRRDENGPSVLAVEEWLRRYHEANPPSTIWLRIDATKETQS